MFKILNDTFKNNIFELVDGIKHQCKTNDVYSIFNQLNIEVINFHHFNIGYNTDLTYGCAEIKDGVLKIGINFNYNQNYATGVRQNSKLYYKIMLGHAFIHLDFLSDNPKKTLYIADFYHRIGFSEEHEEALFFALNL